MFPEFHMTGGTKATRYRNITMKTFLRNTIVWKKTQPRLRFEFISFKGRKRDKGNTIEYSKRGIVWEFFVKQLKERFLMSGR